MGDLRVVGGAQGMICTVNSEGLRALGDLPGRAFGQKQTGEEGNHQSDRF